LEEKEIDNKMIEEILIEVNDTNKREAEKFLNNYLNMTFPEIS